MWQEFDVVCLGGGVAGEAIAVGLQDSGLTLAVVDRELVGGECPYWGCVPLKTLLRSGETLTEADRARARRVTHGMECRLPEGFHTRAVGYIHDFHRGALKLVGGTLVTPRAGEIVLAIKPGTPLKTLADVIHPFPAFNRIVGESLDQFAAAVVGKGEHHEQYPGQH